tara:strand:- start:163 stop:405 length:243 start_codon:yes stop_codon:yes gene_type:complete
MEFIDTPNPNSKKIVINHDYELAEYLDIENGKHSSFVNYLLNHKDIKNIFSGPDFLTITKLEKANWDKIIKDLADYTDNI